MAKGAPSFPTQTPVVLLLACLVSMATPAAQVSLNLAGEWTSNINVAYTITQAGNQFVWQDASGTRGTITMTSAGLHTVWSDATGTHAATGMVTASDAKGQPTRIQWSNGVIFERRTPTMLTMTHIVPLSPSAVGAAPAGPAPGQAPTSGGTGSCPKLPEPSSVLGGGSAVPDGSLLMTMKIAGVNAGSGSGFLVRSVAFTSSLPEGGHALGSSSGVRPVVRLRVRKRVDAATPRLLQMHMGGAYAPDATIAVYGANARPEVLWTFSNVGILSHRIPFESDPATPGEGPRGEEFELTFEAFRLHVFHYSDAGAISCTDTGFNLVTNKIW